MEKVMVAGHICLDITPRFQGGPVAGLAELLAPGKLVQVGKAAIHTGGVVANTGLAMHFFGANVVLVGKVGRDAFGQVVAEALAGRCPAHLIEDAAGTSYTVVLAAPGVDRVFLHNPGANDTFTDKDIPGELFAGVTHFHFGYPPLMRALYEDGGTRLAALLRRARECGATTSLDMAAVDPASPAGEADWLGILEKSLPYVDFYLPSIEETGYMLAKEKYHEWNRRAAGGDITRVLRVEEDIRPLAQRLHALGAGVVVLKCGAPGLYYSAGEGWQTAGLCARRGLREEEWSGLSGFELSYEQPKVVSGTGAGDTSIAAFLTAMLMGRPLRRCAQLAAAAGACCISAADALSGLEPLDVLEARIDAGWAKEHNFAPGAGEAAQ